jgi:hypothetical protein
MHTHAGHVLTEEQIECLRGCSVYSHYYWTRKGFETNECPFCIIDSAKNTVLYQEHGWVAWEVGGTFSGARPTLNLQLVFFPEEHRLSVKDLTPKERDGFWEVIDWIYETYSFRGGGYIIRDGDRRDNVGTVIHLHGNLFVPSGKGKVMIPFAKNAYWRRKDTKRMRGFKARYEAGEVPPP